MEVLERAMVDDTYSDKLYILNIIGAMLSISSQGHYQRALEILTECKMNTKWSSTAEKFHVSSGFLWNYPVPFPQYRGCAWHAKEPSKGVGVL